jgi:hypothetical protein
MSNLHECAFKRNKDEQAVNKPPGPAKVEKLAVKLYAVLSKYIGMLADPDTVSQIAYEATPVVCGDIATIGTAATGGRPMHAEALYGSLCASLPPASRITQACVARTAKRLAGNAEILKSGVTVTQWRFQPYPEWCLVKIVGVNDRTVGLDVYSGHPAGLLIDVRYSRNGIDYLHQVLGSVPAREFDDTSLHQSELVGMWAHAHVIASSTLQVAAFACSQSLKTKNKALRERRNIDTRECPKSFPWECYACPIGLDECPNAVRPHRPQIKQCVSGHLGFVPYNNEGRCVTCSANIWRAQRGMPTYTIPTIKDKS